MDSEATFSYNTLNLCCNHQCCYRIICKVNLSLTWQSTPPAIIKLICRILLVIRIGRINSYRVSFEEEIQSSAILDTCESSLAEEFPLLVWIAICMMPRYKVVTLPKHVTLWLWFFASFVSQSSFHYIETMTMDSKTSLCNSVLHLLSDR